MTLGLGPRSTADCSGIPGGSPGTLTELRSSCTGLSNEKTEGRSCGSLLREPAVARIGRAHGKSAPQVALRWVLQQGHALVTSTESPPHMASDLDVFDWSLTEDEMRQISALEIAPDDPTKSMCLYD